MRNKLLLFGSIVFYILFKLPFDTSVSCGNTNEGYYFVYGQHLLDGNLDKIRLPIFFLFYGILVKMFGFGTWSIIIIHFFHTLFVILIGTLIYLVTKTILQDTFFASLAVCFWILILATPIGGWGQVLEFQSSFALEAEYFCLLFSLSSIYFLLCSYKGNTKLFSSLPVSRQMESVLKMMRSSRNGTSRTASFSSPTSMKFTASEVVAVEVPWLMVVVT